VSLKDLRDAGVLLPREEWGVHDLHTSVNKPMLVAALLLGLLSVALMYLGGGRWLTFLGAATFIAFMGWITWISVRAVDVHVAHFDEEREALHQNGAAESDADEQAGP